METIKGFTASFSQPDSFKTIREDAQKLLAEKSFPDRKSEAWKYTRVAKLSKQVFKQSSTEHFDATPESIPNLECFELVFLNGKFQSDLSSYPNDCNIELCSLGNQKARLQDAMHANGNVFTLMNQAYFTDGLLLTVKKNIQIQKPIHVIHISKGEHISNQMRHRIELEEGAEVQVLFSYLSEDENTHFNNTVLEAKIAENAHLKVVKVQEENMNTFHIAKDLVHQKDNSKFTINTITLGGQLVRNDLEILVAGKHCETVLNGAYVGTEDQHIDNHTVVDHLDSDCYSNELYKGIMGGNSTAVFNGKVFVRKDSQRINAFQSNANVLVSETATVNTKPELEIYADDVKCSHGSTTGQLDDDAIFYLRARGMSENSAKKLLVSAFAKATISNIESEEIQVWLEHKLDAKFSTL